MTLTQVCDTLGISQNTAYAWIKSRRLKPLPVADGKKSQRYRFRAEDIESMLVPAPEPLPSRTTETRETYSADTAPSPDS